MVKSFRTIIREYAPRFNRFEFDQRFPRAELINSPALQNGLKKLYCIDLSNAATVAALVGTKVGLNDIKNMIERLRR